MQVCVSSEMKDLHIKEQECIEGKLHPDVGNQIYVFVGLNNEGIDEDLATEKMKKYMYKVEKVYKPAKWKGNNFIFVQNKIFK